jgi:hypothetical protein
MTGQNRRMCSEIASVVASGVSKTVAIGGGAFAVTSAIALSEI